MQQDSAHTSSLGASRSASQVPAISWPLNGRREQEGVSGGVGAEMHDIDAAAEIVFAGQTAQ